MDNAAGLASFPSGRRFASDMDASEARPAHAGVVGWSLDGAERRDLLARFPPRFANVVADHVTLRSKAAAGAALPPERAATIVGHATDGTGVEAMVVAVGGTTDRPDGSTYHITWSLAEGRKARESNDVIRERGWTALASPVPIGLQPARWP